MKPNGVISTLTIVGLVLAGSYHLTAQQPVAAQQPANASYDDYAARTRAIDQGDSRAEKEAERLVSLPPERIILLLLFSE